MSRGRPVSQPNVLLVIPHDAGDHFGCYGRNVSTPNIDAFAAEGTIFRNHFCTSPLCSPARGSLITGQYPHTNGLEGLVNLGWNLPSYNRTDAQRFAESGYETYLVGGQHEKAETTDLAFDHVLEDVPCADGDLWRVVDQVTRVFEERRASRSARPFYMRVGTATAHRRGHADPAAGYFDPPYGYAFAREDGLAEGDVEVFPQWLDTPRLREDLAGFTGELRRLDDAMGAMLAALGSASLEGNTIIAFVPDHGIDYPRGKATMYELGLRTAFVLRVPGTSQASEVAALTSHIDVLPTLLDYCGISDELEGIQGHSLRADVEGNATRTRERIFAEQTGYPGQRMRCVRGSSHKLIQNVDLGLKSSAAICGTHVTEGSAEHYVAERPPIELYDLEFDPAELTNLAGRPEYWELQSGLQSELDAWLRHT
jgi:N-sulfoglucosamine sulfohydrolase